MRSCSDQQSSQTTIQVGCKDDLPNATWVAPKRGRLKRERKIGKETVWQLTVQRFTGDVSPPSSSPLAGLRRFITNGGCPSILSVLCLALLSPDKATIHILILAAAFFALGVIAGAVSYVVLSMVVSLLRFGMLMTAVIVVSGLALKGCTPTIGKVQMEKSSDIHTDLKSHVTDGSFRRTLRQRR